MFWNNPLRKVAKLERETEWLCEHAMTKILEELVMLQERAQHQEKDFSESEFTKSQIVVLKEILEFEDKYKKLKTKYSADPKMLVELAQDRFNFWSAGYDLETAGDMLVAGLTREEYDGQVKKTSSDCQSSNCEV